MVNSWLFGFLEVDSRSVVEAIRVPQGLSRKASQLDINFLERSEFTAFQQIVKKCPLWRPIRARRSHTDVVLAMSPWIVNGNGNQVH